MVGVNCLARWCVDGIKCNVDERGRDRIGYIIYALCITLFEHRGKQGWCRGYHVCFTRRRSRVRFSLLVFYFYPAVGLAQGHSILRTPMPTSRLTFRLTFH